MVAAVAAVVQPQPFASRAGKGLDHVGADGLIAGTGERCLSTYGVGFGLIPYCLETGDALFQCRIIEIGHAGFNGVIEPVEPLVGFRDSLVEFGEMSATTLGSLLTAVEDTGQYGLQPFGPKQAVLDMIGNEIVEPVHGDRPALATGLALPGLGRAGVVAIHAAGAPLAGPERHCAPAFGAEADAGKQGGTAGDAARSHHGMARLEAGLDRIECLTIDQRRYGHGHDLALRLPLPILVRARVEPVLADIGGAGENGVDLREAPAPTVAGEDAALVEMAGDGLDAHRAGCSVPVKEQPMDQPHRVGVQWIDFQLLLGLRSPLLGRNDAIADRRQGAVPEALAGILVHGAQDMLGVLLGLILVEQRHDLAHHHMHGVVAHFLGDGDELDAVLRQPADIELQFEVIAEEAREAVNHDNIEGRWLGRARFDHTLEFWPAVIGGGSSGFNKGIDQPVAA